MKIKSLQIKNFKRFTDLTLQDIPENAKLVLLIGSNGSGKSSVFDALEVLNKFKISKRYLENPYYIKSNSGRYQIIADFGDGFTWDTQKIVSKGNEEFKVVFVPMYGRTSFRQVPRLQRTRLGDSSFDIRSDNDRPFSFIDRDERFENDLEHLFGKLLKEFFKNDERDLIKETVIKPLNSAFSRIFDKENGTRLELVEIIPPLEGKIAQINFKKGGSIFHYNLLSAGEKEIFGILINLITRKDYYNNGILFFDEIDLHLHSKLQYNFIKELIENWITPVNAQLWVSTHSLGFIQFAKESNESTIFDFDDFDFDQVKVLVPEPKDNPNLYNIAVDKDFLSSLFKDMKVVFVENTDKSYYGSIGIDQTVFVQENGRNGVYHKVKNGTYSGIVDRDFLSDEDINQIEAKYTTLKVLKYYSIENYLYHPDNLEEYNSKANKDFNKTAYIEKIIAEKNNVKQTLILSLALKRTEYPYFGEPEFNGKPDQNRFKNKQENQDESAKIAAYLSSDSFEEFYKVFPMKSYATQLKERQHIAKTELAKTNWFKNQIEKIIK